MLTHAFGLLLSFIGLFTLVLGTYDQNNFLHFLCCIIYGTSLVLLYAASTCYHGFRSEHWKHVFKIVDHCAIYILIAGTYTPFTLLALGGMWGWSMFCTVWALAFIGIQFKLFFVNQFKIFSTLIYLMMGWLVVIAIEPLMQALPFEGLMWLVAGGIAYTVGVLFYLRDDYGYNHAIWHLFVLAGSVSHFIAVFLYVIPEAEGTTFLSLSSS